MQVDTCLVIRELRQTLFFPSADWNNHRRREKKNVSFLVADLTSFLFVLICRLLQAHLHYILRAGFDVPAFFFSMIGYTGAVLAEEHIFFIRGKKSS